MSDIIMVHIFWFTILLLIILFSYISYIKGNIKHNPYKLLSKEIIYLNNKIRYTCKIVSITQRSDMDIRLSNTVKITNKYPIELQNKFLYYIKLIKLNYYTSRVDNLIDIKLINEINLFLKDVLLFEKGLVK